MQLKSLLVAATALLTSIVNAQTDCVITSVQSPNRPLVMCGKKGTLARPRPLIPAFRVPESSDSSSPFELCRNRCLAHKDCISFGFAESSRTCKLYGRTLIYQQFKPEKGADYVFYNRHCFTRVCPDHGKCVPAPTTAVVSGDGGCPLTGPAGYFLLRLDTRYVSPYDTNWIRVGEHARGFATSSADQATWMRLDQAGRLHTYDDDCKYRYAEQDASASHKNATYEAIHWATDKVIQKHRYKSLVCSLADTSLECVSYNRDTIFSYCGPDSTSYEGLTIGQIKPFDCYTLNAVDATCQTAAT